MKEEEGDHLWTVNVDGTGLRQLTRGERHDYQGCWLPDEGIAFVSTRNPQFAARMPAATDYRSGRETSKYELIFG